MAEGQPDRLQVRVFTFADHAVTPPDGKLYINGGGVDQIFLPAIPGPLGQLYIAIRINVPWHLTSERMQIRVQALDADRQPVGPDPILQADVEVGRAPGLRPGDENGVSMAFPITGFPVQQEGTIYFHLVVAGQALSVLPLKVRRRIVAQVAPAGG